MLQLTQHSRPARSDSFVPASPNEPMSGLKPHVFVCKPGLLLYIYKEVLSLWSVSTRVHGFHFLPDLSGDGEERGTDE